MRLTISFFTITFALFLVFLLIAQGAKGIGLPVKSKPGDPAWLVERNQLTNIRYARAHASRAKHQRVRRWYTHAVRWLSLEHRQLERRYTAPWLATQGCEAPGAGWWAHTGNGYYGGLQFDHDTWRKHGGLQFARNADGATKIQQVTVANRVTYDAWPHCPNP